MSAILVVRPNEGVWAARVKDGDESDADGAIDGSVEGLLEGLSQEKRGSVNGWPHSPKRWNLTMIEALCELGIYQAGEGAGFLGALVGAVVLLVIYGLIKRN